MDNVIPHFIHGQVFIADNEAGMDVFNPALGKAIGRVHLARQATCDKAILAAQAAQLDWAQTSPAKRARVLFKFRDLLEKYTADLAKIITRENGKTLADAKGSVARAIEVVELYCGLTTALQGTFSANVASEINCYTFREPIGICAGISPFNFPVMVPVWMILPAIACGNAFILKPSEQDPSAPIRLLELLHEAGLPAGVAQCVQGDKTTVNYLLEHPAVAAFTAVASTQVAESIYTKATSLGKRAHTFGAAKNHGVVMPDADLDFTAHAIVGAAFGSAGERCMALSVVVVVGTETADTLLAKLKPLMTAIKIGSGDSADVEMGPLISAAHRDRVIAAIDHGVAEGAELIMDGRTFKHPDYPLGYFVAPTLFDHVTESMSLYQQEIFGPVLVILRVADLASAIALVNRNQFGNGTAIFTEDGYSAREYVARVQVGMVGINVPIPVPIASHPFGGWKRSAFGDLSMHGVESLRFYTKNKTVTERWSASSPLHKGTFDMPTHR